ncbi:hypothetical protein LshimejAT787_1000960 [Lyophyllum shimeji]|uniref:Uncharacterized protein n=1 Tax=Lyophyllum shimeji TaxID=47721 RepID=A0A9P3PTN3_LYOSH|nr:hypothetical protein LshimejAT787_1000960 [Lyophyllum shimeji]
MVDFVGRRWGILKHYCRTNEREGETSATRKPIAARTRSTVHGNAADRPRRTKERLKVNEFRLVTEPGITD